LLYLFGSPEGDEDLHLDAVPLAQPLAQLIQPLAAARDEPAAGPGSGLT
jgi:hypothetical protein